MKEADDIEQQRKAILAEMGIATLESDMTLPQITNINEDAMKNGAIIFTLKEGTTTVGRPDASTPQNVKLVGLNMLKEHCLLVNTGRVVTVQRVGNARTWVNGVLLGKEGVQLKQNDRILFGNNHLFRYNDPIEQVSLFRVTALFL